jgi:hypothetical protein
MNKRILRVLELLGYQVLVGAPAVLASPGARHFIENHPSVAVYLPIATAVLTEIAKAVKDARAGRE